MNNATNFMKFIKLCNVVKEKEKVTYGVNEIENELLEVLNFIKSHKEIENKIVDFLVKVVKGIEIYPLEIIIFCMRELKWEQIRVTAFSEKANTDDWRIISAMNHILSVYETEWDDAEMYEYYSKEADNR